MPKKQVTVLREEYRAPFQNLTDALTQMMTQKVEVEMSFRENVQYYLNDWIYTLFYWPLYWITLFFASIITGVWYGVKDAVNYARNQRFG